MTFEEAIEVLENSDVKDPRFLEALDLAADSLAFASALHTMFHNAGALSEEEDLNSLQTAIDGHLGELAAAAIFLSKITSLDVPKALQGVHANLTGEGGNTPSFVIEGYARLAKRIQALKAVREIREVVRMDVPQLLGED